MTLPTLPEGSHRRRNPLLESWVLCSPHRLKRPWQGQVEPPQIETLPTYDPGCYLCPGNERVGGTPNPDYNKTFAFDNDFSALLPTPTAIAPALTAADNELFQVQQQRGICRVVCFSPRHDLTLARMDVPGIRGVIDLWAAEVATLSRRDFIKYVQVFENRGAAMGCSNPHPHGQIWASAEVPSGPAKRAETQSAYLRRHGRDLLGDYLARERADGARVICGNDHFTALVPFWAVWPFEVLVLPHRAVRDLPSLAAEERDAFAYILRRVGARYDNLFRCSFPYSMGLFGRPVDDEHPGWRLHAEYYPPLVRSATVRKFLVGYEMTSEPQRDLTPEQAAERLRAQPEIHYLDAPAG